MTQEKVIITDEEVAPLRVDIGPEAVDAWMQQADEVHLDSRYQFDFGPDNEMTGKWVIYDALREKGVDADGNETRTPIVILHDEQGHEKTLPVSEWLRITREDAPAAFHAGDVALASQVAFEPVSHTETDDDIEISLLPRQESNVRRAGNLVEDPLFTQLLHTYGVEQSPDSLREAVGQNPEFAHALDQLIDARMVELNDIWKEERVHDDEYFERVEDPSHTGYYPGHRSEEQATIFNMKPPLRFGNFLGGNSRKNHPITGENLSSRAHIRNIARDYITGAFDYKQEGNDPIVGRVYKHFQTPKGYKAGHVYKRKYEITLGSHRAIAQLVAYGHVSFDELQ